MAALVALIFVTGFENKSFSGLERAFAPSSDLWEIWLARDDASVEKIDHAAWSRFLARYALEDGTGIVRVNYALVDDAHRSSLDAYLKMLANVKISHYSSTEQEAYWLNLYNALTVEVILDHYPVASIQDIDISPGLFSSGPWDKKLFEVEGRRISLNDIEHRILRPIWNDPRLHYVINCASIGCPNLPLVALTGTGMESAKQSAARAFVNHPRGVSVSGQNAKLSKIYLWFTEDFGGNGEAVRNHLLTYAEPALAEKLKQVTTVSFDYDWSLNEVGLKDGVSATGETLVR